MIAGDDAVLLHEAEQNRHLLEIGGDIRVVAPQVHVVERDVDHVLDLVAAGLEIAGRLRA